MKKQYMKYSVRILCLLISALMLLAGCQDAPVQQEVTTTTATEDTTTATTTGATEGTTATTGSTSGTTEAEDTASTETGKKTESTFVAAKVPTVSVTRKTSVTTTGTTERQPQETKPDSGALTYKSKAVNGKQKKLTGFKVLTKKPVAFQMLEFEMDLPKLPEGANVFEEEDVDINIDMVSSTGKKLSTDAFYFEEYEFNEAMQLKGRTEAKPTFRIRVSPQEEGTWDFTVTLNIKGKKVDTLTGYVNVDKSKVGSELLVVEPNRKQNFMKKNGEAIAMIGQNIAWAIPNTDGSRAARYVANEMRYTAEYGANYARVWCGVHTGLELRDSVNSVSQAGAAKWDYLFETAEDIGMYISFVFWTHGELSQRTGLPESSFHKSSVYNVNKGGYIDDATKFFTDKKTIDSCERFLRYVVARWGYSEQVMTWELFNEADITDAGAANMLDEMRGWMSHMTDYLHEVDPYDHMVSSSTAGHYNALTFYNVFDFIYTHRYNYANIEGEVSYAKNMWQQYKKPILFGECGLNGSIGQLAGGSVQDDFLSIHQQNWYGLMGGSAGNAMNWFWEGLDPKDGYWVYQVVSEMAQQIPWSDPKMYMANTGSLEPSDDRIEGMGYRGEDYAYLWFYDRNYKPINRDEKVFENATAHVKLKAGTYHVRWIDTRTGMSLKKETLTIKNDGYLEFTMPKWSMDVAVAITTD